MPKGISDKDAIEKAKQFLGREGCLVAGVIESYKRGDAHFVKANVKKDLLFNYIATVRVDANTGDCRLSRLSK
jgi:hypothetical protein